MLPKELEATEQTSMEKLIASETLQPIGNQKRDFKANQKNKTTPQSKHLYVRRCNKYRKAHLSFCPPSQ